MKKYLYTFLIFGMACFTNVLPAQIFSVGVNGITIKSGTSLYGGGLILSPTANLTLANITLSRSATATHTPLQTYIKRVYKFSGNTAAFTGTVKFNYLTAELNGITPNSLQLNIHNGTAWQVIAGTVNTTNNFVLSNANAINGLPLNELTLASSSAPLPVTWLSFTAIKQNSNVLLQWNTGNEQNAKDFTVQFSSDGFRWNYLTAIATNDLNSNIHAYSYIHTTPVNGTNYYRILQTDLSGRSNYSEMRTVKYTGNTEAFYVLGNPVKNGMLQVQVNNASMLRFYTTDGKLLWQQQTTAGLQNIDVSHYAAGLYLLKGNNSSIKIVIQ